MEKIKLLADDTKITQKDLLNFKDIANKAFLLFVMDKEIREYGDEILLDYWLIEGVPDEATMADFVSIAQDDDGFNAVVAAYEFLKGEME